MRFVLILLLLLSPGALALAPPPGCEKAASKVVLVYTRQPRAQTPVGIMSDAAAWQHVDDISRVWNQTEADVVLDCGGKIKVIHNCTASPDICTAQEARVSPDGKRVVYAVSIGTTEGSEIYAAGTPTGIKEFDTQSSELWLYDIPTGTKRRLSSGFIDRMPAWASNGLIVFASDRAGTYAPRSTLDRNFYPRKAFHIYRASVTSTGLESIKDITPGEHFAQAPEVTTRGEIYYSAFQGVAPREFGSTPQNHWWIQSVNINGNNPRSVLGAHGSGNIENYSLISDWADPNLRGEGATEFRALRVAGELWPDWYGVSNYYRGNSIGSNGKVLGFGYADAEGASLERSIPAVLKWSTSGNAGSGRYVPSSLLNMTPYGQDQDQSNPIFHSDGRAAGRAGYPAPLPDSWGFGKTAWMYTHSRGWCYEVAPEKNTVEAMGGEPTCKKEIRIAFNRQVKNPFDPAQSMPMACPSLKYHCWDARPVATYQDLYGRDEPAIVPITYAKSCELRVVNARNGELLPLPPPPGATAEKIAQRKVAFQGNASTDYKAIVDSFGVEYFDHWKGVPTREGFSKSYPAVKAKLMADGSVKLAVDCGRPFLHFGYDKNGNKVASGLAPMAARGKWTCWGCHDGHSEGRRAQLPKDIAAAFGTKAAAK